MAIYLLWKKNWFYQIILAKMSILSGKLLFLHRYLNVMFRLISQNMVKVVCTMISNPKSHTNLRIKKERFFGIIPWYLGKIIFCKLPYEGHTIFFACCYNSKVQDKNSNRTYKLTHVCYKNIIVIKNSRKWKKKQKFKRFERMFSSIHHSFRFYLQSIKRH